MSSTDESLAEAVVDWARDEMLFGEPVRARDVQRLLRGSVKPVFEFLLHRVRSEATVRSVRANLRVAARTAAGPGSGGDRPGGPPSTRAAQLAEERAALAGAIARGEGRTERLSAELAVLRRDLAQAQREARAPVSARPALARAHAAAAERKARTYRELCRRTVDQTNALATQQKSAADPKPTYFVVPAAAADSHPTSRAKRKQVTRRPHRGLDGDNSDDNNDDDGDGDDDDNPVLETGSERAVRQVLEDLEAALFDGYVTRDAEPDVRALVAAVASRWAETHVSGLDVLAGVADFAVRESRAVHDEADAFDAGREAERMGYTVDAAGRLVDASSSPTPLQSVAELLASLRAEHVARFVEETDFRNKVADLEVEVAAAEAALEAKLAAEFGDNDELRTAVRLLLAKQADILAAAACHRVREMVEGELEGEVREREDAHAGLERVYNQIQDNARLEAHKQLLIRRIVKFNQMTRASFGDEQRALAAALQERVSPQSAEIARLSSTLAGAVEAEAAAFHLAPLGRLAFVTGTGSSLLGRRVSGLGINAWTQARCDAAGESTTTGVVCLLDTLGIDDHRSTPAAVVARVARRRIADAEARAWTGLHRLALRRAAADEESEVVNSETAVANTVDALNAVDDQHASVVLPAVRNLIGRVEKATADLEAVERTLEDWSTQPGQFAADWVSVDGRSLLQWLSDFHTTVTDIARGGGGGRT